MIFNPLFIDSETKQINPVGFGKANNSYLFRDIINVVQSSQSQRVFNSSSILNNILNDVRGLTKTAKDSNTKIDDELNAILQGLNLDAGFRLGDGNAVTLQDSTTILGSPARITKVLKEALTKLDKEYNLEVDLPVSSENNSKTKKNDLTNLLKHIENLLQQGKPVTLQLNQTNNEESFTLTFTKIKPEVIALSAGDIAKTAYSISIKQETSTENSSTISAEGSSSLGSPESLIEEKTFSVFGKNDDPNAKVNLNNLDSQLTTSGKESKGTTSDQTTLNGKIIESVSPSESNSTPNNNGTPIIEGKTLSTNIINNTNGNTNTDNKFLVNKIVDSADKSTNELQNNTADKTGEQNLKADPKTVQTQLDSSNKNTQVASGNKLTPKESELLTKLNNSNSEVKASTAESKITVDTKNEVVGNNTTSEGSSKLIKDKNVIINGKPLPTKIINNTNDNTKTDNKINADTKNELVENLVIKNTSKETLVDNSKLTKSTLSSPGNNVEKKLTSDTKQTLDVNGKLSKSLVSEPELTSTYKNVKSEVKIEEPTEIISKKNVKVSETQKSNIAKPDSDKNIETDQITSESGKSNLDRHVKSVILNNRISPKHVNVESDKTEPTQLVDSPKPNNFVESKNESTRSLFHELKNTSSIPADQKKTEVSQNQNDNISPLEKTELKEVKFDSPEKIVVKLSAKETKSVDETNNNLRNNFLDDIQKLTEVKRHSFDNIINKLSKTIDDSETVLQNLRSVKTTDSQNTLASLNKSETIKILDDVVKTNFDNSSPKTITAQPKEHSNSNGDQNAGQHNSNAKEQSKSDLKSVHDLPSAKVENDKTEKLVNKSDNEQKSEANKTNSENERPVHKSTHVTHDHAPNKVNHTFQSQMAAKEVQPDLTSNINTESVKINVKEQFQPELNAKLLNEISDMVISDKKDKVMLNLDPATLGKIKIAIEIIENKVTARLDVENQAAKEMLQHQVEYLKESFNNSGLQLNSLNISLQNSDQKNSKATKEKRKENETEKVEVKDKSNSKNKSKTMGYNTYEFIA